MYLFDNAKNIPITKIVFIIKQLGNIYFNEEKIIGIFLYFQNIKAADYVHTLKAVWIKSNDNFLPNYQATYKGKYLNLLKRL